MTAGQARRAQTPFILRDYQNEAVDALHRSWNGERRPTGTGVVDRAAVVLPTGDGKTVVASELISRAVRRGGRALMTVPTEPLIAQTLEKVHSALPHSRISVEQAERWASLEADVVVASIQSLTSAHRLARFPRDHFEVAIFDECHMAAADVWGSAIRHFSTKWAGLTATMHREDNRHLGDVWQEIVYRRDIMDGIRGGSLVDVRAKRIVVESLELNDVKRSRGDLQIGDLGDALEDADAGERIVEAWLKWGEGRPTIGFAPLVPTAHNFKDAFRAAGIPTAIVTGETPPDERTAIYQGFRDGDVQVIWSVGVLTTGFDAPWASCAIIARPTQNPALYTQMVGRILRPWPAGGKRDALVLDVVGATERLELATIAVLTESPIYSDDDQMSLAERTSKPKSGTAESVPDNVVNGELIALDVDMLSNSSSRWLRTIKGTWFVPTAKAYYFLWPTKAGLVKLGRLPVQGGRATALEDDLTLQYAMAWGERYASDEDSSISAKTAPWRRKRPSEKLAAFAAMMGASVTDESRQGELSDRISVIRASLMLDR